MELQTILAKVPIFAGCRKSQLKRLAKLFRKRKYKSGEIVMKEGEEGVGFFVITSGKVEVIRGLGRRRQTVLATLTPGDFFGEMSLLDDYPRSASIRATEPAQCLVMTRWDFLAEVNKQPDMAVHLLRTLANRLRVTNANLTTLVRRLRVTAPEFTE